MVEVNINLQYSSAWQRVGDTYVRGAAFCENQFLNAQLFAERISNTGSKSELKKLLLNVNGFYSIIHMCDDDVLIASDHIRTWPIFYSATDRSIAISDSSYWIDNKFNVRGYDPLVATEYLFSMYASGSDTLSRDVKQTQAGEIVQIDSHSGSVTARDRHYRYVPGASSSTISMSEFDDIMLNVFDRFTQYLDGRRVFLGLSGGLDSRLIALMLARIGYSNVTTFTYGTSDLEPAQDLASSLGFEHIPIQLSHEDYSDIFTPQRLKEIIESVGFIDSIPELRWLIVLDKLNDHELGSSVLTIGHTTMFKPARNPPITTRNYFSKDEFLQDIFEIYYNRWYPTKTGTREMIDTLVENRVLEHLPIDLFIQSGIESVERGVQGLESWYWQERTPKYLINSNESDFAGFHARWFPLWDRELANVQSRIDYKERGERFMKRYLDWLDSTVREDRAEDYEIGLQSFNWKPFAKATLNRFPAVLSNPMTRQYKKRSSSSNYDYSKDNRFGIISKESVGQYDLQYFHPKTVWYLALYESGYFDLAKETELDRAIN